MSTQYTNLIKATAQACKSKKTGCVVFTADGSESGQIFIKAGKIVGLKYGEDTTVDCLSAITEISQVDSYKFKEIPVIFGGSELPETTVLLTALVQRKQIPRDYSDVVEVESDKPVAPVQTPTVVTASAVQSRGGLSASQKNIIHDNLMTLIGPMADFLVEEHVDGAGSVEEAMLGLEKDIDEDSLAKMRVAVAKFL